MGGSGRKKFIDKKKAITFALLAPDDSSERFFSRVDKNHGPSPSFLSDSETDETVASQALAPGDPLPEGLRREIIECGCHDDGYNYLQHLREIKPRVGAGFMFIPSLKPPKTPSVLSDVKSYDASFVHVSQADADGSSNEAPFVPVVPVTMKKAAVDPDVLRLLDESNEATGSQQGDDSELEEDFVYKATLGEDDEFEEEREPSVKNEDVFDESFEEEEYCGSKKDEGKFWNREMLSQHMDTLQLEEYNDVGYYSDYDDAERENLVCKLNNALKMYVPENIEVDTTYRAPVDASEVSEASEIIRKTAEYAEKYLNEIEEDTGSVLEEESSDESEAWDCETIVSTYSNLDNHPGKISAPENPKKRFPKFPRENDTKHDIIMLRGKEMIPVQYLPLKKKSVEKEKKVKANAEQQTSGKVHKAETKEEKKERKVAVKEERREARRAKKELKGVYKCESQKAQKVAAFTGPSSIHLM